MTNKLKITVITSAIIAAIAIPLGFQNANAQTTGQAERPQLNQQQRQFRLGAQAGPAAMVADSTHIYILQGNRLLKVNKAEMRVENRLQLPPQEPMPPLNPGNPPTIGL